MLNRVVVTLPQSEFSALLVVARDELRSPSDQVRAIVREVLAQRGLLVPASRDAESRGAALVDQEGRSG